MTYSCVNGCPRLLSILHVRLFYPVSIDRVSCTWLIIIHGRVIYVWFTKTYNRVLQHFFWPGLKQDVVKLCCTCHVCQCVGKSNQVIHFTPLHPVPVIGEPFEGVIVDCVGPLPKMKSGNQLLLTIMCAATRFPEAVPLRWMTASSVTTVLLFYPGWFRLTRDLIFSLEFSLRCYSL